VAATVIQRAYRTRLLKRTVKLASYKYREKTEGRRNQESPPETKGLLCRRIGQLYGGGEDTPTRVELQSEVLLHAAPPLDTSNVLPIEDLRESLV